MENTHAVRLHLTPQENGWMFQEQKGGWRESPKVRWPLYNGSGRFRGADAFSDDANYYPFPGILE